MWRSIVDTYHHIPSRVAYFSGSRNQSLTSPAGAWRSSTSSKDVARGTAAGVSASTPEQIAERDDASRLSSSTDGHDFLPRQHFLVFRTGAR